MFAHSKKYSRDRVVGFRGGVDICSSQLRFLRNRAPPLPRCVCVVDGRSTCSPVYRVPLAEGCVYHPSLLSALVHSKHWLFQALLFREDCNQQTQLTLFVPWSQCLLLFLLWTHASAEYLIYNKYKQHLINSWFWEHIPYQDLSRLLYNNLCSLTRPQSWLASVWLNK